MRQGIPPVAWQISCLCEQFGYKPEEACVQLGWLEQGEQLPYGFIDDICFYRALHYLHGEFQRVVNTTGEDGEKQAKEVKKLPLYSEYQEAIYSAKGMDEFEKRGIIIS